MKYQLRSPLFFLVLLFSAFQAIQINFDPKHPKSSLYEETFVIVASNDIHGAAFPKQMTRADTKQSYARGGLAVMGGIIDLIKQEYGSQNVLYLDGGDHFQGGIEASKLVSSGKIINEYFNSAGAAATAIGNHEFDFGPDFLWSYLKNNDMNFLSANIYSQKDETASQFLPNTKRSSMFVVGNNFKIGVIGLTTMETPTTSSGFTQHLFPDYQFKNYTEIVLNESKALKANGAHAVVLMAHEGNSCPGASIDLGVWRKNTTQKDCPDGPITRLLDLLPSGTIDAVVQGHKHEIVHFFRNGVPIVGGINGGYYFNLIYMTFSKVTKKLTDTYIEGPIPVCQRIFSGTKKCNYVAPENLPTAGQLTNWKFHGYDVVPSRKIQTIFNEWLPKMEPYFQNLVENQVPLTGSKLGETELGNLISDLYFNTSKALMDQVDFALINPGSIRTDWMPGVLQYQDFYNMFPFSNKLESFSITGKQLKDMFTILQAGHLGFYICSGLDMNVTIQQRSLVSILTRDGQEINDDDTYIGVTSDFMLNGGDDMKTVFEKGVYTPRDRTSWGDLRDLLKPTLMGMKVIQTGTLMDPDHPRLNIIDKQAGRKTRKELHF